MRTDRFIIRFSLLLYMLKIVHNKFFKKDPVGKKNKEFNYKMLDLDWDDMLVQGLVNILGSMVSAATTQ